MQIHFNSLGHAVRCLMTFPRVFEARPDRPEDARKLPKEETRSAKVSDLAHAFPYRMARNT